MAEPVNTKPREFYTNKGKIPLEKLLREKQGAVSDVKTAKATGPFDGQCDEAMQEMDLAKVDNDNRLNYRGETIKKKEPVMKNIDFGKLHDQFEPIVDAKKKPGAGE